MFENILVAYDGSIHAAKALNIAIDLCMKYGSALNVVMAVNLPELPESSGIFQEGTSHRGDLDRAAALAEQAGVPVVTHMLRGTVADTIERFAMENKFDLVIVGARGHNAVKRFLMGSVSAHLVANLDCPVMVVKEKNA
ncbi:MAG: universal stress protein [Desulfotomaculaceae bacterium]